MVLGLQAKGARADFDAATDVAGKQSNMSKAKSRALGADIAFGVAGAAAITGVVVFLLSGESEEGAGFALGPTGASYTFTWGR